MKLFISFLTLLMLCGSCRQPVADPKILTDHSLLHRNLKQLTEVIIHDAFSPPVASRIYAYTSLPAYQAIRFQHPSLPSLTAQLNRLAS